jgi:hypothetical protein
MDILIDFGCGCCDDSANNIVGIFNHDEAVRIQSDLEKRSRKCQGYYELFPVPVYNTINPEYATLPLLPLPKKHFSRDIYHKILNMEADVSDLNSFLEYNNMEQIVVEILSREQEWRYKVKLSDDFVNELCCSPYVTFPIWAIISWESPLRVSKAPNGDQCYYLNGKLHRHGDLPAVERANGGKEWWVNGVRHRETRLGGSEGVAGLPAIEHANGDKHWYVNGVRHRDGGLPAVEKVDGTKEWYVDGKRHRDDGLPAIEWANGTKFWYVDGKRHRDGDLPAAEWANGGKEWWINGNLHRVEDFPL